MPKGLIQLQVFPDSTNRSSIGAQLNQQPQKNEQRFQNVNILRARLSILCLSSFYYGYCLGYISTLSSQSMVVYFGSETQNSTVKGFLIGILTLGAGVGALSLPLWMKCFTRRNIVILFNFLALIVEGVIQYPNLYCLFVCHAFQGYIIGILMGIVPVYMKQLCPKQILGHFGAYTHLFSKFGLLFAFAVGLILTKAGVEQIVILRIMFGLNTITILCILLCCIFKVIPQSPNSLMIKGQQNKAKRVLNLFIKDEYVDEVFRQKLLEVGFEKDLSPNSTVQKINYSKKAYFIGFLLPLGQQLTGVNAIATEMGGIATQYNATFGQYLPLVIIFVQFITTFGGVVALKMFGRRPIIVAGSFGLGICDVLLGILFFFIKQSTAVFWVVLVILIIFMTLYSTTIGSVVWMYSTEIMPSKVVPLATSLYWVSSSFCLIVLPIMSASIGSSAVFFLFGGLTLLIGVINFFGVIETKGLSLKQISSAYQ